MMVRIDHNGQEPGGRWHHVGVPTDERGAPPIPHEGHFRVAILRGVGVVEDGSLLRFSHHQKSSLISSSLYSGSSSELR